MTYNVKSGVMELILCCLVFICVCLQPTAVAHSCQWKQFNFQPLDTVILPWKYETRDSNGTVSQYLISLCRPLSESSVDCGLNSSVCWISGGHAKSIGNAVEEFNDNIMTENSTSREFMLQLEGSQCMGSQQKYRTFIIFKCGKTLGYPEFLETYACHTYFEWYTAVACRSESNHTAETTCYVYDANGRMRDLNPLIKTSSSHRVVTGADSEMFINVCRDIPPGDACAGFGSCLLRSAMPAADLGQVVLSSSQLQIDDSGDVFIEYYTNSTSQTTDCTGHGTSTTVRFRCPGRQLDQVPKLLSSAGCHYEVEWETEYACPVESLVSHSCQLNIDQHGIHVDLSPLASDVGYVTSGQNPARSEPYNYTINVCSNSSVMCMDKTSARAAVCQRNTGNNESFVLGQLSQQTLRYSDGQLSLRYGNGSSCHSGFHREAVILLHCNVSAGIGHPTFSSEDSCTYIFDWETQYACVEKPASCQLLAGRHLFDLSLLMRTNNMANWIVDGSDSSERLIINVCRNISSADADVSCPRSAAVCLIKQTESGRTIASAGQFKTGLSYQSSNSISLHYTNGSSCGTSTYSTTVAFRCQPGDRSSRPILLSKSADGCHFDLVWYTSSACAVGHQYGDNCQVNYRAAGFNFDLRKLTKTDGNYLIVSNSTNHNYYINVCETASNTPCANDTAWHIGVCQIDRNNHEHIHSGGIANKKLSYYDGMLKLVYKDGDRYNSAPVNRSTEIIFLCDNSAGDGSPYFKAETDRTYTIEWYTALACLPRTVECSVADEEHGLYYDLTGLIRSDAEGNWVTEVGLSSGRKRLHINICRSVLPITCDCTTECSQNTGVCATEVIDNKETITVANGGQPLSGPKIQPDGDLLLEYVDGQMCVDSDNTTKSFSVSILLHCADTDESKGPSSVEARGLCAYNIRWETPVACPRNATISGINGSCVLTDPATGVVYDLRALAKTNSDYAVNNTGRPFTINICGVAASCPAADAAVCSDDAVLGLSSTSSLRLHDGLLQLLYHLGETKVEVNFVYNESVLPSEIQPRFVEQVENIYIFEVATSLAYVPVQVTECQAYDKSGRKYDLSPLVRHDSGWHVTTTNADDKYIINVCHSVNNVTTSSCRRRGVGGCHLLANGTGLNTGFVVGPPVAVSDNTLVIRYKSGDVCSLPSTAKLYRSTTVMFHCSLQQREPVLLKVTRECEYIVDWRTPYACPLSRVVGADCQVTDSRYHVTFNVRELHKTSGNAWVVNTSEGVFSLNVCGPLSDTSLTGSCSSGLVGACLVRNGTAINVGNFNDNLEYEDGQLMLKYSSGDGKCRQRQNYTTTILFTCHHNKRGTDGPQYLPHQSTQCSHWFEWPASHACLPFRLSTCTFTDDDGKMYDLSSLILSDDNYEVMSADGSMRFALSICTSLVHTRGVSCSPYSAACLITNDQSNHWTYTSIGRLSADGEHVLSMIDSHLTLTYEGGDNCTGGRQRKTIITLVCDEDALTALPEYSSVTDNCTYRFVWSVRAACPADVRPVVGEHCAVTDPTSEYLYDLSPLKTLGDYVLDEDADHMYNISICQPLKNSRCHHSSGCCQREKTGEKRPFNAGNANSALTVTDGLLVLTYTDGDPCHHVDANRSSVITFVCAAGNETDPTTSLGRPHFVNEDDCTYKFTWPTTLACPHTVSCVTHSEDQMFDLSSLTLLDHNHRVSVSPAISDSATRSATFYINICRPVAREDGIRCPVDASVCREDADKTSVSLGRITSSPVYNVATSQVVLTYDNGGECNSGRKWRSIVTFTCEESQLQGQPVLIAVDHDECEYRFEWPTAVICKSSLVKPDAGCNFVDKEADVTFDLSILTPNGNDVHTTHDDYEYYVGICGKLSQPGCEQSSLCRLKPGAAAKKFTYNDMFLEGGHLKLLYDLFSPSSSCGGVGAGALIIRCNELADVSRQPHVTVDEDCRLMLSWETPLACSCNITRRCSSQLDVTSAVVPSHVTNGIDEAVQSSRHTVAAAAGIAVVCIAAVLIVIGSLTVLRHADKRHAIGGYVRNFWHRCRSAPSGYSLLGGNDRSATLESHSLLPRLGKSTPVFGNIQDYDSDDDLIL